MISLANTAERRCKECKATKPVRQFEGKSVGCKSCRDKASLGRTPEPHDFGPAMNSYLAMAWV